MPLSSKDYKAVLEIIDIANSIPDRTAMFKAVCEKIERLIGISSANFLPIDPDTRNFVFPGPIPYNADLKPAIYFCLYYAPLHPLVAKGIHKAPHETIRLTDIVPASRLEDTEYGHDFQPMIPIFYGLSTMLSLKGDPIGGLGLFRKKHERDFSDRDKEIINIIAPHLSNAFHNINLMEKIASSNGKIILLESIPSDHSLKSRLSEFSLSKREKEIAILVVKGLSGKEIAGRLFIQEQTVRDHLRHIFVKMKIHSRRELVARLLELDSVL